jgi:hypothetical protein
MIKRASTGEESAVLALFCVVCASLDESGPVVLQSKQNMQETREYHENDFILFFGYR